jgi:cytoskeletal protein CcmA (bactofilin family)
VLGAGIVWKGNLSGAGGVRIEGAFEGEIALRGLLVVGATGRVTCQQLRADAVVVAGHVKGNITAEKLTIRTGGRVMGDVVVTTFSTEEGAFLKGTIEMREEIEMAGIAPQPLEPGEAVFSPFAAEGTPAVEAVSQPVEPPPGEISAPLAEQAPPSEAPPPLAEQTLAEEPPSEPSPPAAEQAPAAEIPPPLAEQTPPAAERKPARSRKKSPGG